MVKIPFLEKNRSSKRKRESFSRRSIRDAEKWEKRKKLRIEAVLSGGKIGGKRGVVFKTFPSQTLFHKLFFPFPAKRLENFSGWN
ncbi:MAG: hypothetical protein IIV78_00800 [Oscillospiraceae bacterium]|nr:hypothetical protein [Oscillospiraceae bacterium]